MRVPQCTVWVWAEALAWAGVERERERVLVKGWEKAQAL